MSNENMAHLNGNLLCCVAMRTSGPDPMKHEIIEFACCPLDTTYDLHKDILMYMTKIRPDDPEGYNSEEMRAFRDKYYVPLTEKFRTSKHDFLDSLISGVDKYLAADLFVEWFENLKLSRHKQIMPLAHNWSIDTMFLINWLGLETYRYIFHPYYRDTVSSSLLLNDRADARGYVLQYPYPKNDFQYLCSQTQELHPSNKGDVGARIRDLAMVYKYMVRRQS